MRLIDADALKQFEITMPRGDGYSDFVFAGHIHQAPTIDAVPVVRCKDCRYYLMWSDIPDQYGDCYTYLSCLFWVTDNNILPSVKPNDFCSYGELKNGQKNT